MAGPQQAPHLHLAELTASQFLDIWRHFDADGQSRGARDTSLLKKPAGRAAG